MNRIDSKFRELKKNGKKALIIYITAGDPSLSATSELILGLEKSGADIVELGIPFSDPLADGPTIQAASQRALKNKINLKKIFSAVKALRGRTGVPVVFMTYCNPVFKYGISRFFKDCAQNGVDGVIIPDLPSEEARGLVKTAKQYNIATIFLAAPTSTRERLSNIAKDSTGFIYYVSLTGVTGARKKLPQEVASKVRLIKSMTKKPVCVGFGVSRPEQAKQIARFADGVIVGSAVIKIIEKSLRKKGLADKVYRFTRGLAKAVHG